MGNSACCLGYFGGMHWADSRTALMGGSRGGRGVWSCALRLRCSAAWHCLYGSNGRVVVLLRSIFD